MARKPMLLQAQISMTFMKERTANFDDLTSSIQHTVLFYSDQKHANFSKRQPCLATELAKSMFHTSSKVHVL